MKLRCDLIYGPEKKDEKVEPLDFNYLDISGLEVNYWSSNLIKVIIINNIKKERFV